MKPKTKNILLGVSLGLNLLLGLLVGGALIKACADKPAENASSGLSLSSSVKMHDRNEKKALEPKKRIDVESAPDLMDNAVVMRNTYFTADSGNIVIRSMRDTYNVWSLRLEAGVYAVTLKYDNKSTQYFVPKPAKADDVEVYFRLCEVDISGNSRYNLPMSEYSLAFRWIGTSNYGSVYFFSLDAPSYIYDYEDSGSNPAVRIVLVDTMDVAPQDIVTFPVDYNPLSMFGLPYDGYLFGELLGVSNPTLFIRKTLSGVFRIDGLIYDQLYFDFYQCNGQSYLANDGSIRSWPANASSTTYYPAGIYARPFGGGSVDGLWQAKWSIDNSGNTYYANAGAWLNNTRQSIAVLDYDASVTGLSSVFPSYNVLDLLKVRTASSSSVPTIGGDGNADVFGLLGQGFTAVAGIMNIQILPYLTLGTLVFVPLVVLVILAILKVLNK